MRTLRRFFSKLTTLFSRRRAEEDFTSEVSAHLALMQEDFERQGMSPKEARRQARLKLGGIEQTRELYREARSFPWIESLWQDVRFGCRMLRKNPGFTTVAVLTLALGIGANTAVFSIAYAILFRPPIYPNPDRLVGVVEYDDHNGQRSSGRPLSTPVRTFLLNDRTIFAGVAANRVDNYILKANGTPESTWSVAVTGDYFSLLGVPPLLGRPILPSDCRAAAEPVLVLGYSLWRDSFGSDPGVVGRSVTFNDRSYSIIGVMPPEFRHPLDDMPRHIVWFPATDALFTDTADWRTGVMERLKDGVSLSDANSHMHAVAQQLIAAHIEGAENLSDLKVSNEALRQIDFLTDRALWILLGAVGFILAIACMNVSAMTLARGFARRGEVAIRATLGATRLRLAQQRLVETLLLALAGGALGFLLGLWTMQGIRTGAPAQTPWVEDIRMHSQVLWFALAVTTVAGLFAGLAPTLQFSSRRLDPSLRQNRTGSESGRQERWPRRIRNILTAAQVALAVVLVMGAALGARSLQKIASVDLGIRSDHVVTMSIAFSRQICESGPLTPSCVSAVSEVIRRVQGVPGVEDVATTWFPPTANPLQFNGRAVRIDTDPSRADLASPQYSVVSPAYFHALRIPIEQGRSFADTDGKNAPPVAIVNQAFARRYFGGNAVGHRIGMIDDKTERTKWMDIVGVVPDGRDTYFYYKPMPGIYVPFVQAQGYMATSLLVRTSSNWNGIVPAIEQRVWSVDSSAPITKVRTIPQLIADVEAVPRFGLALLSGFAVLALFLALIGTYGVISYTAAQRTHEIGVRIALGANSSNVLGMILREGMLPATFGIALGVAASLALTRLIRSFLYEVRPNDPLTFSGTAVLLLLVAAVACYIPARRATRVDPVIALRHE